MDTPIAVITGPPDVLGRSPGCHSTVGFTQCHTVAIGKREKLHPGAQEVNDWATQQIDYGKWKRRGHSKRWTNEARRQLLHKPRHMSCIAWENHHQSSPRRPWDCTGSGYHGKFTMVHGWFRTVEMDMGNLWDLYTMVHGYKMLQVVQNR